MSSFFRRAMDWLGLQDDEDDALADYERHHAPGPYGEPARVDGPHYPYGQAPSGGVGSAYGQPGVYGPVGEELAPTSTISPLKPKLAVPEEPLAVRSQATPLGNSARPRSASVKPVVADKTPKVQVINPREFPDSQQIGDLFKSGTPVIINLCGCSRELTRRIIDFCSGVTYALGGKMDKVADQVFLITPSSIEASPEERRLMADRSLYGRER